MNAAHQQGSPSSLWSSSPTAATRGAASQVGLRAISPSGNTDNTSSSLFSGGCQHFDSQEGRQNAEVKRAVCTCRPWNNPLLLSVTQHGRHSSMHV